MNKYCNLVAVTAVCISGAFSTNAAASNDDQGWYLRPTLGLSNLSDTTGTAVGISTANSGISLGADVNTDTGFLAGLGIGYQYGNNISAEFAWEYRSNDSAVILSDGSSFDGGDYASNTFFLNGIYHFDSTSSWQPYVGAGIAWVQEIDIDLEDTGQELSFSSDGDVGAQVFAGLDYQFSDRLSLQTEIRFTTVSGLEFDAENTSAGRITDLDYQTTTLQLALKYNFR